MKGKLLFYLLFALLWGGAATVQAEIVSGKCGAEGANVTWTFDTETGKLEISGTGAMENKNYEGIPWRDYLNSITSVTINDGVTSIGEYAFALCSLMTSVTIPESVTAIGPRAFYSANQLRSIKIPQSVTSIGDMAFLGCINLEKFEGKFASDDGRCLIVNGTLKAFAPFASERPEYPAVPYGLSEYRIPDEVNAIGDGVFAACYDLKTFTGKFASSDGHCLIVNDTLKAFAPREVRNYTVPAGVTAIANFAFFTCIELDTITISAGVTSIGEYAFDDCQTLNTVTIPGSLTTIGKMAFSGCISLEKFKGELASEDGRYFVINDTLRAFAPSGLSEYAIPEGVAAIGTYAFSNCKGLKTVTIPNSVAAIDSFAFCQCDSLASVTIGKNVTSICDAAFAGCCLLEKFEGKFASDDGHCLIVNDTLKAFAPDNLTEFTIPDDVTVIGEYVFNYYGNLTSVTIGESVTTIAKGAFELCDGLTSVTIGKNVTTIGEGAFRSCSALKSITVNNPNPVNVGGTKYNDAFYEVDAANCKLYVPKGSIEAYQNAEGWNEFGEILPIDESSAITETQQEQADGHITVYNLQGVSVLEADDAAALRTLSAGAYIVNGKTMIIAR